MSRLHRRYAVSCCQIFAFVWALTCVSPSVFPQPVPPQPLPALWELQRGNRFIVETTTDRISTIEVAQEGALQSSTTDRLTLEYSVEDISMAGDVRFRVRVLASERDSKAGGLSQSQNPAEVASLEGLTVRMLVARDGIVDRVPDFRRALVRLAGQNPDSQRLLQQTCFEETFKSWFGRPFWLCLPDEERESGVTWQRTDDISLGLLGSLRVIVTCTIDSLDNPESATVRVTGTGRHVARMTDEEPAAADAILFQNVSATLDDLTGRGEMNWAVSAKESSLRTSRPAFESLTLEIKMSGSAEVVSGGRTLPVTWSLVETESTRLLKYESVLSNFQLPFPSVTPQN